MAKALHYTYIQEEESRPLHHTHILEGEARGKSITLYIHTGGGKGGVGGTWQEHNVIHTYRRRRRKRRRSHVARTLHYTHIQTHTHTHTSWGMVQYRHVRRVCEKPINKPAMYSHYNAVPLSAGGGWASPQGRGA